MFDDFDYKKALGGGGKLVKGVVKAVSPDAGPGVDEAGGGLGDILKAAGVELTDDEAAEQAQQPQQSQQSQQPQPPKKSNARRFDEFGMAPKRPPREVRQFTTPEGDVVKIETPAPEGTPWNDREITASLLASRGWQPEEVDRILAGPSGEPARREEAKAARVKESDATTDDRTAVVNAAQPAKRVQTAKAQRIKK